MTENKSEGCYCSFCGRHNTDDGVEYVFAGPENTNVAICSDCVMTAADIYFEVKRSKLEDPGDA